LILRSHQKKGDICRNLPEFVLAGGIFLPRGPRWWGPQEKRVQTPANARKVLAAASEGRKIHVDRLLWERWRHP
jgi:hypothetical protein